MGRVMTRAVTTVAGKVQHFVLQLITTLTRVVGRVTIDATTVRVSKPYGEGPGVSTGVNRAAWKVVGGTNYDFISQRTRREGCTRAATSVPGGAAVIGRTDTLL